MPPAGYIQDPSSGQWMDPTTGAVWDGTPAGAPVGTDAPLPVGDYGPGSSTFVGGAPQQGVFNPRTDRIISSSAVPGGTQVIYRDTAGNTQVGFVPSAPASSQTPESLAHAAAAANFFKPDGTPDTAGFLAYRQTLLNRSLSGPAGPAGTHIPSLQETAAARGFFKPDGSIDTAGYLASKAAEAPNLGPSRSAIATYLQALLGQNALPYNGISTGAQRPTDPMNGTPAPVVPPPTLGPAVPGIQPVGATFAGTPVPTLGGAPDQVFNPVGNTPIAFNENPNAPIYGVPPISDHSHDPYTGLTMPGR